MGLQDEVRLRREKVVRLLITFHTTTQISKKLKIPLRTAQRDVKIVREEGVKEIREESTRMFWEAIKLDEKIIDDVLKEINKKDTMINFKTGEEYKVKATKVQKKMLWKLILTANRWKTEKLEKIGALTAPAGFGPAVHDPGLEEQIVRMREKANEILVGRTA